MGLGADPAVRDPAGPFGADGINFGQLVVVDSQGDWTNAVDIAGYEAANNPDGGRSTATPSACWSTASPFRSSTRAATACSAVDDVAPAVARSAATADISTLAVLPKRMVEFPPGSGQMMPMDAVPTAVELGPDGAYYVSQLTGFPYPVGGAAIWRVVPGEEPQPYAGGFTNILDLAFSADGSLFVLEMAKDSLLVDPPVGRITQITPYGARIVIAERGADRPVDMELGPDHALYVANFGPVAALGQVVRIPLPPQSDRAARQQDNTLYESETARSATAGPALLRRAHRAQSRPSSAAVSSALTSPACPVGSVITSATVELHMSKSIAGITDVSLHKISADWGEGALQRPGRRRGRRQASPATRPGCTPSTTPTCGPTPGGDFAAAASATTPVDGSGATNGPPRGLLGRRAGLRCRARQLQLAGHGRREPGHHGQAL